MLVSLAQQSTYLNGNIMKLKQGEDFISTKVGISHLSKKCFLHFIIFEQEIVGSLVHSK